MPACWLRGMLGLAALIAVNAVNAAPLVDVERLVRENEGHVLVITGVKSGTGAEVQSSGCFVHAEGYVLATAHQVTGVEKLQARDLRGRVYPLEVVQAEPQLEIALLRTTAPIEHWARLGNASSLHSGAPLVSIAAPTSLDFSTVTGIVSNTNRTYRGHPAIQADLPASPGSSGGPVFDRDGFLIGFIIGKLQEQEWVTVINPINNAYPMLRDHGIPVPAELAADLGQESLLLPVPGVSEKELRAVEAYNRGVSAVDLTEKARAYGLAVQLLPDFYEAWFNLAITASRNNQPEEAVRAYRAAEQARPDAVEAPRNLGRLLLSQDDREGALACFTRAAQLAPGEAQSHNDLGEVFRQLNRLPEAQAAFEKALEADPNHGQAHFNLGLVCANSRQYADAIEHFQAYLRLEPQAQDRTQVQQWIEKLRAQ